MKDGGISGKKYLKKKNGKFVQQKFANAILKYGWDAFDHVIIEIVFSEIEADKLEQTLIDKYDSINNGYNTFIGGNLNHSHTEETKKKISDSNKGRIIPENIRKSHSKVMKNRKLSNETKEKISKSLRKFYKNNKLKKRSKEHSKKISESLKGKYKGENNSFYGKTHSEETKEKFFYRKVRCINTGEIFESINMAAAKYNISRSYITRSCSKSDIHDITKGKTEWEYIEDIKVKKKFPTEKTGRRILCIETNEIFKSAADAARHVGLYNGSLIIACCRGKKKTAKNFHWKYLD